MFDLFLAPCSFPSRARKPTAVGCWALLTGFALTNPPTRKAAGFAHISSLLCSAPSAPMRRDQPWYVEDDTQNSHAMCTASVVFQQKKRAWRIAHQKHRPLDSTGVQSLFSRTPRPFFGLVVPGQFISVTLGQRLWTCSTFGSSSSSSSRPLLGLVN